MAHPKYKNIGSPVIRLLEECGELIQAVTKGDRFGWDNCHPGRSTGNLDELYQEKEDLDNAFNDLINHISKGE